MNEFEKKLIDYNIHTPQIRDLLYSLASRYGIEDIRHGFIPFDSPNPNWTGEIVNNFDSSVLFIVNTFRVFNVDGATRVIGGHMIDTDRLNGYLSITNNTGVVLSTILNHIIGHRIVWTSDVTSITHLTPNILTHGYIGYHRVKLKLPIEYA